VRKVLIANRHVRAAGQAVPLAGVTPGQTYLDMSQVLRAAAESGADALHPGYRVPGRERRVSPISARRRADLDRAAAGGDQAAG